MVLLLYWVLNCEKRLFDLFYGFYRLSDYIFFTFKLLIVEMEISPTNSLLAEKPFKRVVATSLQYILP